jgi:hypothetical protein
MQFWPFQTYVLKSKMSSEQLKQKFNSAPQFQWSKDPNIQSITVSDPNFANRFYCCLYRKYLKIQEKIEFKIGGYTNSFRPEATIKFEDTEQETTYSVTMMLKLEIRLILLFAILFISVGGIVMLLKDTQQSKLSVTSFTPAIMIIGIYLLSIVGFNVDRSQLESFIYDFLEVDAKV